MYSRKASKLITELETDCCRELQEAWEESFNRYLERRLILRRDPTFASSGPLQNQRCQKVGQSPKVLIKKFQSRNSLNFQSDSFP